ncbi:40S ribosomal protein S6 [Marasmius sp. AFHP31]|nr:40S ribosomal protein S6 [Marasmius sp. AFHP31]
MAMISKITPLAHDPSDIADAAAASELCPESLGYNYPISLFAIFAGLLVISGTTWRYLRFRFPCLRIGELRDLERAVDQCYFTALARDVLYGTVLDKIVARRLAYVPLAGSPHSLERSHMQIRLKKNIVFLHTRSLEMDAHMSFWRQYLGFHPELLVGTTACFHEAQSIVRDINVMLQTNEQQQWERELDRRPLYPSTV